MNRSTPTRLVFILLFSLVGIEAIIGIIAILAYPITTNGKWIISHSPIRLALSVLWLVSLLVLSWFARKANNKKVWTMGLYTRLWEDEAMFIRTVFVLFQVILILITILFLPSPTWGRLAGYLISLTPLLTWFLISFIEIIAALIFLRSVDFFPTKRTAITRGLLRTLAIFVIFLFVWILIITSRIGVGKGSDTIRSPTVFISYRELLIAIILGIEIFLGDRFIQCLFGKTGKWSLFFDLLICVGIWVTAVFLWTGEPMRGSYNLIGPFPPSADYFPASDSSRFDLAAQLALIGQGLDNHKYIDNPLYVVFVMVLRLIEGQEFSQLIFLQISVLAFTPVILYFIGKMLKSRSTGVIIAAMWIMREVSIIYYAADHDMAPVRVLLTEPFITLLLALFSLCLLRWLKKPSQSINSLLLAGGFFGFSTLVRANPWFLLPVVIGLILLRVRFQYRPWFIRALLFSIAVIASILPWMWRSQQTINTPFYMWYKFQHTPIEQRFGSLPTPPSSSSPGIYVASINNSDALAIFHFPTTQERVQGPSLSSPIAGKIKLVFYHFFYNFENCIQIMPTLLPNDTPGKQLIFPDSVFSEFPKASLAVKILGVTSLILLLVIIAVGMGLGWERHQLTGIFPVIFFLTYSAGTAVAVTSGSRYTQPIEWVVLLYFSLGLAEISRPVSRLFSDFPDPFDHLDEDAPPLTNRRRLAHGGMIVLGLLLLGMMLPLSDFLFPRVYTPQTKGELVNQIDQSRLANIPGMTSQQLQAFARIPNALVQEGRILYVQYYESGEGIDPFKRIPDPQNYPRMTFVLIGPTQPQEYIIITVPLSKIDWPAQYLNGKTAIVIGCYTAASHKSANGYAVIMMDMGLTVHQSQPINLACP